MMRNKNKFGNMKNYEGDLHFENELHKKSLVHQTYFEIDKKTAAYFEKATVYHSHESGYSLKSCSPAELFAALPDNSILQFSNKTFYDNY
jgi:hypothetical protein